MHNPYGISHETHGWVKPVSGMTIDAEGETVTSVTIENADELRTRRVSDGGQVYLGQDYGGQTVTFAFRVEGQDDETDDSDSEDTES